MSSRQDGAGGSDQARRIASHLRERIVRGALAPGVPLRQEQLATEFGTSRMPVREALRLLQAEGFVELVRNRGAMVAPIDLRDLAEIHEMRVMAEAMALRHAIPNLSNRRIDAAAAIQDELETAPLAAFGDLNKAFHLTLYEASERPRLLAHVGLLNDAADRYLRMAIGRLDYAPRSHAEHRALLAACRDRDVPRAVALLEDHVREAGRALHAALAAPRD
ncbi:MAG: transcriptional regulator [Stappia sp.]|nr:transcriptional regulator [Stappia sp.]